MTPPRKEAKADGTEVWPAYLRLSGTGELAERARRARELQSECRLCPRGCLAARLSREMGICATLDQAVVASYGPHHGEESCLSGWRGSGTIFFSGCSLGCVFCQNHDISQRRSGEPVSPEELAEIMLQLQAMGCHNVNLVTPTHVVPQILEALELAAANGLRLPLVYNTSGYDSIETLQMLDGVVDIYMPDVKFLDRELASRYLNAPDYPEVVRAAVGEMHRQTGPLTCDDRGLARRGVLVRHLVMPGCLEDTKRVLRFLASEISARTYVNVMAQYRPEHRVSLETFPEIARPLSPEEYQEAILTARGLGLRLD
ncbi:MAG: radical SAM protein [Armatimonadota bacterium]|nr:MAG: radical SAM protein [Armatimonadota bacterium]